MNKGMGWGQGSQQPAGRALLEQGAAGLLRGAQHGCCQNPLHKPWDPVGGRKVCELGKDQMREGFEKRR